MPNHKISQIENFAKASMDSINNLDLRIAHDYKHADRVRGWALQIAQNEGFENLEVVEATALLHDIGLAHVTQRKHHAQVGADMAAQFLNKYRLFSSQEIEIIAEAIRYHASTIGGGKLGAILRDADKLELFGAIGILRCLTSRCTLPDYDPQNIKGNTWQMSIDTFEDRFRTSIGVGDYIIDYLNFQMSLYSDLYTKTAQEIALPLIEYAKTFVLQLESEVNAAKESKEKIS